MRKEDIEIIISSYESIPREEEKNVSREMQAILDIRKLLGFMEKRIFHELSESDLQEMEFNKKQLQESISILKEYIE